MTFWGSSFLQNVSNHQILEDHDLNTAVRKRNLVPSVVSQLNYGCTHHLHYLLSLCTLSTEDVKIITDPWVYVFCVTRYLSVVYNSSP
jgi:hypothetical protein